MAALFRRPLTQVGLGVVAGGTLIAAGALILSRGPDAWGTDAPMSLSLGQLALIVAYSALMFGVCLPPASSPRGARSGWSRRSAAGGIGGYELSARIGDSICGDIAI